MTTAEVLERLKADGVGVTLAVDLEATSEPNPETLQLIRDNRDVLLEYLARECVGTPNASQSDGLTLYGDLLHSLCVWVHRYHELRLEHPGGVILGARPEHITAALTERWGVVYTAERHALITWGSVPRGPLMEKCDLLTNEPLVPETRAA